MKFSDLQPNAQEKIKEIIYNQYDKDNTVIPDILKNPSMETLNNAFQCIDDVPGTQHINPLILNNIRRRCDFAPNDNLQPFGIAINTVLRDGGLEAYNADQTQNIRPASV